MKYNRIIPIVALTSLLLSINACKFTDGFEEDPNNAGDAPTSTIYNSALVATIVPVSGETARLASMWTRQFTGSDRQYSAYENYITAAPDFSWDYFYTALNTQVEEVIKRSTESKNDFYRGNMLTLKGLSYGTLTSLWGDVPYSEANKFPEIQDPKFDAQAQVYEGVQKNLDDAIAAYATGLGGLSGATDIFYNGNKESWTKATYSLKARYFLHVGNYPAARAAAQSGIASVAGDMLIPHKGTYGQNLNLYNSFLKSDRPGYLTAQNSFLAKLIDPASPSYRGNAKTDESARFAYIFENTPAGYDINYTEKGIFGGSTSFPVITYVETQLILAEAAFEGGDRPAALSALNAVRAYNAATYKTTYAAYTDSDLAGASLKKEILTEKYISLAGQLEPFTDMRRTKNLIGIPPATGTELPQRFLYPQSEVSANENAPSPIPGLFQPTTVNQ